MMIMGVSILYPSSLSRLALDALLPRIALRNPCAECRTASFSYCVLQFVPPWLAMRPWWYGVDCEEKFGKKVGPFFSYSYPKFHGYDYISTSWKLASASLDFASVATVSSRYFLAVRAWPVSVCDSVILTFYQVLDDGNTLTLLLQPPASTTS